MKENSRIRFNPITKEVEVEGSESFVKTYFSKLQAMIPGSPKEAVAVKEKPVKVKAASKKKVEKKPKAVKSPVKKVKKSGEKKVTNIDKVIALIQASTEGIKTDKLIEKTGLNKNQIWNIVNRATKEGKIKKVKMGLYGPADAIKQAGPVIE
jgi:hypothetical protein